MTDKIDKVLATFTTKEKQWVQAVVAQLLTTNRQGLQIKKLKGHADIFRVRKGRLRVIFKQQGVSVIILAIERRSEKTYRGF